MARDNDLPNRTEVRVLQEFRLWENFRTYLRGARDLPAVWERTMVFLTEAFLMGECVLALTENARRGPRFVGWRLYDQAGVKVPSATEEGKLHRRWGELVNEALKESKVIRRKEGGRHSFLFPLIASEGPQGVLVLADVSLTTPDVLFIKDIALEVSERLAILQLYPRPWGPSEGAVEDAGNTTTALEKERKRADELEGMLVHVTQEAERRSKELSQMREQWLSLKCFNEAALESLSSGLVAIDAEGQITYFNRGAERILLYSADEVMGKALGVAMASKDKQNLLETKGIGHKVLLGRQTQVMRGDGTEIPVEMDVSPFLDARGRECGKIIHFRDLTKIKEMQEELLRIGRLGSLGEISMGIAHEIRNPLAAIRITGQALEEEVKGNRTLREYVARIISEIDRLNELLKSFISFAKPQRPELVPCHIPDLLQDVFFLVKKDLEKRGIQLWQDHAENLPAVSVDVNQMKQVLLNLILNSIQSIAKNGEIRVRTSVISKLDGREIIICVEDTGKGIREEHLAKIFDPFFTTKAKGLGMGLSNTYRIIKRHGGSIRVKSEVGKGTSFFIHLPLEFG
jgi:PAS domain S-box-containing protein